MYAGCIYFAAMPILPKYHAPLRMVTADILLSPVHSGKLYGAEDIAHTINNMADVTNHPSMSTKVNVTALIHAFANQNENHFFLPYDGLFWSHRGPKHAIRPSGNKTRADDGSRQYSLLIRCFSSMEAGWGAYVVLVCVTMDYNVRGGLVCYISRSKNELLIFFDLEDRKKYQIPVKPF